MKSIQGCEGDEVYFKIRFVANCAKSSSSYSYSDPQRSCDVGGFDFLTPLPVDLYKYLYQPKFRHLEKSIHTLIMLKGLWFKQEHVFASNKQTIVSIAELLNISESTLRRHIAQLKAFNLVTKKNKHYHVCSTEKLMVFLGCDISKLDKFKDGTTRFKTAYINLNHFNKNPQKAIEDVFLKRLEKQQLHNIRNKVKKVLKACNVNTKVKKSFKKSTQVSMEDYVINTTKYPHVSNYQKLLIPKQAFLEVKKIQTEVVLSCKAMAKKFNRKAIQTGANKLKRCSIARQRRLKSTGVKFKNRNELFNFRMANEGHFVGFKGVIFESLTSSFTSLVEDLNYCSFGIGTTFGISYSKK